MMTDVTEHTTKELCAQILAIRQEMRTAGIRRISCFNGGYTGESFRFNARMYAL